MYECIAYEVKCHLFKLPRWSLSELGKDTVQKKLQCSTQSSSNESSICGENFTPLNSFTRSDGRFSLFT